MQRIVLLILFCWLATFGCSDPQPLDPASYNRTCAQNSDCVATTLLLEPCTCNWAVVALSDEGLANYEADYAATDRDCNPFESAVDCVVPQPAGPPVCIDGQCETTDEGGCSGECRGVDGEG